MSRPIKWRKICCMPLNKTFAPSGSKPQGKITMTIDEYETIRLMDLENCTQETCAMAMNVARTTVQKIYEEARYKLADALINGKELSIEGGEFRLCEHYLPLRRAEGVAGIGKELADGTDVAGRNFLHFFLFLAPDVEELTQLLRLPGGHVD